ncbi:MAG: hypothetical protein IKW06_03530 [Clostridia bacterium]|nr:hypothetical protein [Clostridia bacterium]
MKRFRILRNVCITLALLLSHGMCAETAFNYRGMLCGIEHKGFSAPASIAFIFSIPYVAGIIICLILALLFHKKAY